MRLDTQSPGQPIDIVDGDVPLAALDGADVGPVKPGELGQGLLRNPALLAYPAQVAGERHPGLGDMACLHEREGAQLTTLSLQTISFP